MKKDLYLMRHGQTLFNVRRKIQGWCDSPLTELGKQQALKAKENLKVFLSIIIIVVLLKDVVIRLNLLLVINIIKD